MIENFRGPSGRQGGSPGEAVGDHTLPVVIFSILSAAGITGMGWARGEGIATGAVTGAARVLTVIISVIINIVGLFVSGVIMEIFVHVAGGRKGVSQTIKALAYAATRYHRSISSAPSGALFYRYSPSGSYMRSQPSWRFLRLYFRCSLCPPDDRWNEHDLDGWNALKIPVTTSFFFSCHQRPGSIDSNPCPFAFIRHPFITPSA